MKITKYLHSCLLIENHGKAIIIDPGVYTYDDLYQIRLNTNTELAMLQIAEGKETMDKGLAQRIREKTDKEFQEELQKTVPVADLAEAREELQKILDTSASRQTQAPQTQSTSISSSSENTEPQQQNN